MEVDGEITGSVEKGLLVYLGISNRDTEADIDYSVNKIIHLRIFPDVQGRMNLSVGESGGGIMVISQFTLYGDTRKGRRPSYDSAAAPETAGIMYDLFLEKLKALGFSPASGRFQAHMDVKYTNDGPVTILVDSEKKF